MKRREEGRKERSERKFDGIEVFQKISLDQEQDNNSYLLVKFEEREKHFNVTENPKEGGTKLGLQLSQEEHQNKKRKLDKSLENWLEDVGVVLVDGRSDQEQWENNHHLLVKFQER